MAVNATAATVPLEISAKPLKAEHFQWMVNLKHSFAMQDGQPQPGPLPWPLAQP